MQQELALFLLIVAGVVLLGLVIFSLRARYSERYHDTPEVGEISDILDEKIVTMQKPTSNHDYRNTVAPIMSDPDAFEIILKPASVESVASMSRPVAKPQVEIKPKVKPTALKTPKIIALYISAAEGQKFAGYELLQAIAAAHFHFGAWSIFHRHQQSNGEGKILFSLTRATEPGTFDADNMGACECSGLSLFMQSTGDEEDLQIFHLMLATAEQLAEDLYGVVTDKKRKPLTAEQIADYEDILKAQLESVEA